MTALDNKMLLVILCKNFQPRPLAFKTAAWTQFSIFGATICLRLKEISCQVMPPVSSITFAHIQYMILFKHDVIPYGLYIMTHVQALYSTVYTVYHITSSVIGFCQFV